MAKTYGLDIEREEREQSSEDWVFGASNEILGGFAEGIDLMPYMPTGELQRGKEDFQDCVTRAYHNIIEAKINYMVRNNLLKDRTLKFLKDNKYFDKEGSVAFSDRFIAIKSGTTRNGNSIKAPIDAIHRHGLIPKSLLPASKRMSWEEYHDPKKITAEMEELGKEFLSYFLINYDKVFARDFNEAKDLVAVGVNAWQESDGVYINTEANWNHCVANSDLPTIFQCFDNYLDTDGDWVKKVAPDYFFYGHGYRVIINESAEIQEQLNLIQKAFLAIIEMFNNLKKKPMNKITELALAKEGTDFTPDYPVSDEVSCALAVTTILKEANPTIPIITGTWTLDDFLAKSSKFERVSEPVGDPKAGDIVISPTGYGNGNFPGHVGIYIDKFNIMSNNSNTGLWETNYTRESWRNRYFYKGGFPIRLYRYV